MKTLHTELNDRLLQLENRKMMIPRYLEREGSFIGRKDFSMDDIPKIEQQIEETKAAIRGIEAWRKNERTSRYAL